MKLLLSIMIATRTQSLGKMSALGRVAHNARIVLSSPSLNCAVKRHMLTLRHQLQVFGAIVQSIAVDVMNNLVRAKWSPYAPFHDYTMLISVSSVDRHSPVTTSVYAPAFKTGVTESSGVARRTLAVTELSSRTSSPSRNRETGFAGQANQSYGLLFGKVVSWAKSRRLPFEMSIASMSCFNDRGLAATIAPTKTVWNWCVDFPPGTIFRYILWYFIHTLWRLLSIGLVGTGIPRPAYFLISNYTTRDAKQTTVKSVARALGVTL